MAIQTQIEQKLASLTPDVLRVENESHMHHVPPDSETHFKVTLVSERFAGLMPVKRHQLIYSLLAAELALPHRVHKGPFESVAVHLDELHDRVEKARTDAEGQDAEMSPLGDGESESEKKKMI